MKNKRIFGVTGLFSKPDDIMRAANAVSSKHKNFDVHTPYPVHGMDDAMKMGDSKLGYVALVVGLTGAAIAMLGMWWMMAVDYPNVIGGKSFFPFPAFIPITFEVTVLSAAVGTALSMLFVFFKLPNNMHPLHDTPYMDRVSSDKFGVCIEAKDPHFTEEEATAFLTKLNAENVTTIYYPEENLTFKAQMLDPKFIFGLIGFSIVTALVTYFLLNKLMFMPPFNWMMEQEKLAAQRPTEFFADGFSMRQPVSGTVSKGSQPYLYADSIQLAEANLVNPLMANEENLTLGKKKFDTFCSPCHGYAGEGDARLNGQFPNPPNLHRKDARAWKDGHIYHIITVGQNTMPAYDRIIEPEERWAIVLYVRALQEAMKGQYPDDASAAQTGTQTADTTANSANETATLDDNQGGQQ